MSADKWDWPRIARKTRIRNCFDSGNSWDSRPLRISGRVLSRMTQTFTREHCCLRTRIQRHNAFNIAITCPADLRLSIGGHGAVHFFLPRVYGWEADLRHTPAELRWALLSLNCFFSLLLLCAGVAAIASWWRPALGV